ncbi:MAG: glycogen debranching protein, partial [Lachnospiraceae bacterium]|nr:glycogen debranching protein [Lachnospiraceae bacterium]
TATVSNTRCSMPPSFVLEVLKADPNAKLVPNWATEHEDYEASQWPVFLPALYGLWKDHPDPSQNVFCDLTVIRGTDGRFRYARENGPVTLSE